MPSPTPRQVVNPSSWNSSGTTLTSASFNAYEGDVLLVVAANSTSSSSPVPQFSTPTNSGAALTWTLLQQNSTVSRGVAAAWVATVPADRPGLTVTLARVGSRFGFQVYVWQNAEVGASAQSTGEDAAPLCSLTTTAADSAIVTLISDYWESSGTRTWRTSAGTATETAYQQVTGYYSVYGAYWPSAGSAGAKSIGLTAPAGQGFGMVAVELKYHDPALVVQPDSIPSQESWGTVTALTPDLIVPDSIPSAESWGTVTVAYGDLVVTPDSIPSSESWGTVTAQTGTWQEMVQSDLYRREVNSPVRTTGWRVELVDYNGTHLSNLPVISGSVDFDGSSAEQWKCTLVVLGSDWVPVRVQDPFGPASGVRVRVWWCLYPSGDYSGALEVPLGTYVIEDPKASDDGEVPVVTITGLDPLSVIRRGGALVDVSGLTVPDALAKIMQTISPNTPVRIDTSSDVRLPDVYELAGDDVLSDMMKIGHLAGYLIRTDREGTVVMGPVPDPQQVRVDWQEGENCRVVGMVREWRTSTMINSVTVVSSSTEVDPPVSATEEDTDPSSPTWVGGLMGRRPSPVVKDDKVTTVEAARNLARGILNGSRRPTERIVVDALPDASLEYRELIPLSRGSLRVGDLYRLESFSMTIDEKDADPSLMRVKMREKSVIW